MILIDEKKLLEQIALGNEKSFSTIYDFYYPEIRRYVLKFVKSDEYTEDLCQEIFLKVWDIRGNLVSIFSFRAYLFVLARNITFNFLKHAAMEKTVQEEIMRSSFVLNNYSEEEYQTTEYLEFIDRVLAQIPPRSREIFELCRVDGHTYKATAEQLGISNNAVKKHMIRTMKYLKNTILKEFGLSVTWIGVAIELTFI
ncbi:RNA polymerase sigma-70 factor (ECF subfamily) [Dyadobacter jejuensis]|uniref:RNA polymerase sigma-70 factor (ECF subfamily) n=1 Tax=Dyadobacter jejuensis TaxID=1082580 RepID=A0A316AE81_9BACT|nr:RNA polymerase sigma-70 factor [Dyadobacter jejuensis]PWJ55912.1 RNA polymerase sigma-70 factor (ECF subfamily) [Dyadobacter jejuensis]